MPLAEEELPTLPEHLSSPPVFSGVRVTRSLLLCVLFSRSLFVLFLLTIMLCVLLRFTDSAYPFGIFKLFLEPNLAAMFIGLSSKKFDYHFGIFKLFLLSLCESCHTNELISFHVVYIFCTTLGLSDGAMLLYWHIHCCICIFFCWY